jgi:hypothetical protein
VRALPTLALLGLSACATAGARATVADGEATFTWTGEADAVYLAGTPTSWRRVPLPREDGRFTLRLRVPPGRHEYRLEVESGGVVRAVLPPGSERVEDGFGGENAILRVGGS